MNNELLMNAIAEISDRHILEFMDVKPRKKHKAIRISIISAAACLMLIITAVPIRKFFTGTSGIYAQMPGNVPPTDNMTDIPFVRINGSTYNYAGEAGDELPDGYTLIGTVVKNDSEADGYSEGCYFGEKIFGDPDDPNNICVYTRLFDHSEYRYVKFQKSL